MPATDDTKNRNAPKPGHKHLNIPNVPEPDLLALHHAAIDQGITRPELVRALLHTAAEQHRGQGQPGPTTGYKVELTISMPPTDATKALMDHWMARTIKMAEDWGGTVGGGYHQVDDNGNPTH